MIFFTSDTHFGHANIIKYCKRPFTDKYEMDRVLIERWNATVGPRDIIYHLGDFSFYGATQTAQILSTLNGYKILIRGNHDKGENYYRRVGFNEYHTSTLTNPTMIGEYFLSHYPYWETYTHDERKHKFADRMLKAQGNNWLLCGHVHDIWKNKGRCINVGVDVWDYRPISFDTINDYRESLNA